MVALLLTACGSDDTDEQSDGNGQGTFEITEDEKIADDEVVLNINGTDVMGDRYNLAYLQTKAQLFQFGEDTSDRESLKELALNALVEQQLLEQDADEKGVEVSEEEIESEFESIKSDDEEHFESFLEEYHFTEDTFKMQLSFAMLYDKYIESVFPNIEVSDEEIEDVYNDLKSENEDIADLEDIKDFLRAELTHRKEGEKMQERIEELKEEADIETKI